ncbi:MAG: hypothetical protein IMW91_07320 [Firmicutes bacterium]|nr:hypothetical protein [Bacillota bacterium]
MRKHLFLSAIFGSFGMVGVLLSGCGPAAEQSNSPTVSQQSVVSQKQTDTGQPVSQQMSPPSQNVTVIGQQRAPLQQVPTLKRITAIDFPDDQHGFVAGATEDAFGPSLLVETSDGANHWNLVTQFQKTVWALRFATLQQGYVVTQQGGTNGQQNLLSLETTKDGGQHWSTVWEKTVSLDQDVADPSNAKIDLKTGHDVALLNGQLLFSTDDGVQWKEMALPKGWVAIDMIWRDARNGLVVARSAEKTSFATALLYTSDGGKTWQQTASPVKMQAQPMALRVATDGQQWWYYAKDSTNMRGLLYTSSDLTRGWKRVNGDLADGRKSTAVFAFTTAKDGLIGDNPGAGPIEGNLWQTHDGGRHWSTVFGQDRTVGITAIDQKGERVAGVFMQGQKTIANIFWNMPKGGWKVIF